MKTLAKIVVVLLVLGGGCAVGLYYLQVWWVAKNKPIFRQTEVARGDVVSVVNSTGTLQPEYTVPVGSFVSGPIKKLYAYYNDEISKEKDNLLLAEVDPEIYEAARDRDQATVETREAELERIEILQAEAEDNERRAVALWLENEDFISEAEMDQVRYGCLSLKAQLKMASAAIKQAKANLKNSEANVGYTKIYSPVEGIVIDRKIDEGQTLAAQFQTPELFVIAPNMKKLMHIHASVDEADIGLIREAQDRGETVHFTVDAYPDDLFEGKIHQTRYNPTTVQNVVTYPVVVAVNGNEDLKLLPGMTANLSFQIARHKDVLKVPNAALRFFPRAEHVRPKDRPLLEGAGATDDDDDKQNATDEQRSAVETAKANRRRNRRHVWVVDGPLLKAVEIVTGLSDYEYTEVTKGPLKKGQKVVTGIGTPKR
ncbi:MAG: efflux RND transporter periplasmic adaptor subunit [Candidatus Nealsonbacteria bacterium]|nr:efflux RND transporter periplasmic adaptor subunit [Candidatus Nealsonbacteria bacterium]